MLQPETRVAAPPPLLNAAGRPLVTAARLARRPRVSPEELRRVRLNGSTRPGLSLDTAIVGAGVGGLYTAWRLTGPDAPRRGPVHVFEMSERIGGRLLSVKLPGLELVGELGGMRYMRSQKIVTALIEQKFADVLTHVNFPMGRPSELFGYFRKQRMRQDAWDEAQKKGEKFVTRYHLEEGDVGFSADQLLNKVAYDVLRADPWFTRNYPNALSRKGPYEYNVDLKPDEWDVVKVNLTYYRPGSPYNGMKLNDLGFWNVLKDQITEEGYEFIGDAGGYYSNTINWNAAEAFPYIISDFTSAGKPDSNPKAATHPPHENLPAEPGKEPESPYWTIQGGYDLIAYALAQSYLATPDSAIWTHSRLVALARTPEGPRRYRLTFHNAKEDREWTVDADNVVLAMPRRSLELLGPAVFDALGPDARRELEKNLPSVIIQPSFKILMAFDLAWWTKDFHTLSGHSITDLPMRQCYYFGTDPHDPRSLLLGSYNDMRTVGFWEVLAQTGPRFTPRTPRRRPEHALQALQAAGIEAATLDADVEAHIEAIRHKQAPEAMVNEVVAELAELHGLPSVPKPYVTYFQDWSGDPYGGGYHGWCAGIDVKRTMEFMRRPSKDESIHIVGEAYSDQQGWVEGAFCTAEWMLRKSFGLDTPKWFPDPYYMGW